MVFSCLSSLISGGVACRCLHLHLNDPPDNRQHHRADAKVAARLNLLILKQLAPDEKGIPHAPPGLARQ